MDSTGLPTRRELYALLDGISVTEPEWALIAHVVLGLASLRADRDRLEKRIMKYRLDQVDT